HGPFWRPGSNRLGLPHGAGGAPDYRILLRRFCEPAVFDRGPADTSHYRHHERHDGRSDRRRPTLPARNHRRSVTKRPVAPRPDVVDDTDTNSVLASFAVCHHAWTAIRSNPFTPNAVE